MLPRGNFVPPQRPNPYRAADGVVPMANGALVTKPTVMLLGENGTDTVVPMNNQPGNRVSSNVFNRYRGGR